MSTERKTVMKIHQGHVEGQTGYHETTDHHTSRGWHRVSCVCGFWSNYRTISVRKRGKGL